MRFSWSWLIAMLLAAAPHAPAAAQDAPHQRQAREIYERLISFRTAAGHGQVPPMVNYIAETLRAGGVPADDIAVLPHEETAAMLVRVPGTRRRGAADPLLRPYGRGRRAARGLGAQPVRADRGEWLSSSAAATGDNKAGVASMVSTILRLRADRPSARAAPWSSPSSATRRRHSTRPGWSPPMTGSATPNMRSTPTPAAACSARTAGRSIYVVQGAEKTFASFRLDFRNPGGHSSRPRDDNAIYDLARALLRIEAIPLPGAWPTRSPWPRFAPRRGR